MQIFIFIACVLIIIGRLLITPRLNVPTIEGAYESFAHIFVGYLIGMWIATKGNSKWYKNPIFMAAASISLFELFMFLLQKFTS